MEPCHDFGGFHKHDVNCSLISLLKGGYVRDCIGTTIGVLKGDTRSLDSGSRKDIWGEKKMEATTLLRVIGGF